MTPTTPTRTPAPRRRARLASHLQRYGVLIALALLVLFGALRYDGFLSAYNVGSVLSYNAMFGLIALGMTFVIMTGGIDLSVGSVAALASVVGAILSPHGLLPALIGAVAVAALLGLINGLIIAYLRILPFITTLAMLLAARGLALMTAGNQSVSADFDHGFTTLGQGSVHGVPYAALLLLAAFAIGAVALRTTRFGRHVLAIGGNEEASRLMGLPVERTLVLVYTLSGALAGLAGVLLASQFGAGQPTEGVGWELTAIAAVVVGGTLLTGGVGSVGSTLVGALLLGVIFNVLNFENGKGTISLSVHWQSVIRGAFLLVVVILQQQLAGRRARAASH
ncbi:ABC transporter permease [Deinococcus maricopensis]|uniref:ABC-type transporter, integral membrane subunit n=1 Tax=Deinococcus maricopensis (strain DSM 21211 / LMG 22137 / NRRL B-23946 / LB-34) TaxID=709986 RepID=E8U4U3_DEIML|nr:ABC transporter permease [Deinococcus maricopensis]ADV66082.1 ABC-type transporter, integral membrane subunit [Deinococcus maricopensis DSM 21211]